MDLTLDQRYLDFRAQVQSFIAANRADAPPAVTIRDRGAPTPAALDWQRRLIEAGYAARNIPAEYGGFGAPEDILENSIIHEEFSAAGVQAGLTGIGIMMLVPTLLEVGTAEQKARYIPKAITGGDWWCQGYSEPGSGSDLASLRTNARLEGEEWVINGQKIWTSGAHYAQMMFCLVRTEPDAPQRVQPGVLRRRAHPRHQHRRRPRRGLEGRQRHAEARARRARRSGQVDFAL
jgi:alkylation response protein AidB-like acyl-CoA dehydrogenase